jgi:hypothetical protein
MPNVQRLVDGGLLFNRSYAPMPVCCPVRAIWISGAYPWHNGVHTQVDSSPSLTRDMEPDVVTYSQRLHNAGFRQGFVGKWHASQKRTLLDFGFDDIAEPGGYGRDVLWNITVRPGPPIDPSLAELRYTPVRSFTWPGSLEPFDLYPWPGPRPPAADHGSLAGVARRPHGAVRLRGIAAGTLVALRQRCRPLPAAESCR